MTLFDRFLEEERMSLELSELSDEEAERADVERALADEERRRAEWFAARDSSWQGLSRPARGDQLDRIHEKAVEMNSHRDHLIDTYREQGLTEDQWRAAFARIWRED